MKQATQRALAQLNARFYAEAAGEFSATRRRPWPGLVRALAGTWPLAGEDPARGRVLDVGCGNGRALPALRANFGDALRYHGIDASEPLLAIARARATDLQLKLTRADFVTDPPEAALPPERCELVLLLGVLHCVPSEPARRELLRAAGTRVAAGGTLIATVWRYDRDPRFAARCIERERYAQLAPGVDLDDLEAGDRLLGFGSDRQRARYAHFPDEAELARLQAASDLPLRERFSADGAGQQLNEYLVFG